MLPWCRNLAPEQKLTRDDGGEDGCAAEAMAVPEHEAAAPQLRTTIYSRTKVVEI